MCEAALSDGVGPELDGVHHRLVDTIGGGFAVARRVRRFWSEDEKRRIVAQTWAPGVSVSQVGRRYDVNANLIFKWRRDPRYRPAGDGEGAPSFLPVEVVPEPLLPPSAAPAASDGRIEIALVGGHRVSASGSFDVDALCRVVRALVG